NLRNISNHHRDRHGFPERPREGKKDGTHDSLERVGDHHMPRGLPSVGANRQGGLALLLRDRQKHFTRYGYNERDNHDREHDTRGEITHTINAPLNTGRKPNTVPSDGT